MMIWRDRRVHHPSLCPCRDWYVRTLRLLEDNRTYWERTQPTVLCGFAMDRTEAAIALAGQQPGTFVVRCVQHCELLHRSLQRSLLPPGSAGSHAAHRGKVVIVGACPAALPWSFEACKRSLSSTARQHIWSIPPRTALPLTSEDAY